MKTTQSVLARRERRHAFMFPRKEQIYETESYVSIPPALHITDGANNVWTLGETYSSHADMPKGEYAFSVLRNGEWTGEWASRIEKRGNRIRIFTVSGYKAWNGRVFV